MKKLSLKSLVLGAILTVNVAGITAFAVESGVFNYSGTNVYYSINKGPYTGNSYNYADAKTSWAGKTDYVVTAYVEAVNNDGQRIGSGEFNYDSNSVSVRKSASNVYAFNGSHAVASRSNVYSAHVTTWTNKAQ